MLEAFKDAKGNKSSVGGPFVGAAGGGGGAGFGAAAAWGGARGRGIVVLIAAAGLAFVLGVLVGRSTAPAGEVQAAGETSLFAPDADPGGASPWIDADDEVPAEAPAEGVSPLVDPRNKYTIVAISFSASNDDLAFENYDHLIAKGLPAFPPFPTRNGVIVVVVGAAPKESALADSLSRLQRLSGPNGKGRPYEDAYTHPIRKLIGSD
jgi:hypothetical protein